MYDKAKAIKVQEEVCKTAKAMADAGLTAGTWGNISGRIDDDYMVITPSGMSYAKLTADQMVICNMHDFSYEGDLKPSVEVPIHSRLLLEHPEINGIVHVHSSKALAVAVTRKGIPAICDDQVQILGGDIRCADYTFPGSPEMAESVAACMTDRRGALIANHGSIAMAETLEKALVGVTILEKTAQIWIDVQALGGYVEISKEDCEFFHDFFKNKYGQKK